MSSKFLAAFSNNERYFAHVNDGGKLLIWDVISCTLKNEYTPDVHLISPFTDLHWVSTSKKVRVGSGSRKRTSKNESTDLENEYLLLGSRSSDIYLFSVSSCSIVNTFENGHTSRINSIAWCRSTPGVFYSCSDDPDVVQWDIEKFSVKRKWRCGSKISCLVATDDGKSVVTAKREIQWWNSSDEKKNLVKTFIGHATDVQLLVFARICGEACVLSAAVENRLVHAWLLSTEKADRGALATFAVDDALMSLTVKSLSNGGVNVLASSRTGVLHLFQCTKNGKKHVEPIKSKLIVQIGAVTDQEKKTQGDQLPIIGATFADENSAYIAYGSDVFSFEKLDLKSSDKSLCLFLLRQDPRKKSFASKEESLNKILPTSTSKNVHYVPAEAVNGYFVASSSKKLSKRASTNAKNIDVPLERRLDNLIVDVPSASSAPDSDSLVHLLLQGLKSKDTRLLIDIIENKEENVIKSTVNRLPLEVVIPFSAELISLLQGKRSDCNSAVKWLQYILTAHAAQLISNPDVIEIFAPIFPFIESRLNVIGPLYRLVGRLDMMVKQIEFQENKSEQMLQNVNLQPKYIYQDEDSDEEEEDGNEVLKEETISNEDSDDHWDEMSEVDMDSGQEQTLDIEMDDADL